MLYHKGGLFILIDGQYIDEKLKRKFRKESMNIVEVTKDKVALIPKGTKVLRELQSDEEFEKLLSVTNWAVTQTINSNILLFDSDPKYAKDFNQKLSPFFNRRRDKYIENSLQVNSQHGFLKIIDATHDECLKFAKKFHNKSGIEIFAESHWVIFAGSYYNNKNLDNPKRETTWYRKDDLHNESIMEFTKKEIGNVFVKLQIKDNKINSTINKIPAGQGLRHNIILSEVMGICQKFTEDNQQINFEKVYRNLTELKTIDGISEYENGNGKTELEQMILWAIENVNEKGANFGKEFMESRSDEYFAHIKEMDDEFNCWFWDNARWSSKSAHHILEKLEGLHADDFVPTSAMAKEIKSKISASNKTLKIDPSSSEYLQKIHSVITNTYGQYYDLKSGKIKQVDPSEFFFTKPQIKLKFEETKTPLLFLEFLDERYSVRDQEILIDHLAGGFIHVRDIGAKTKILYNQGEHDTWKSLIVEMMETILVKDQYAEQSFEHISKSNFGKSLIANKLWNFQEEIKSGRIDDVTVVKEIITAEDGKCEFKNGRDEQYIERYPRHFFTANKIQPISKDDDDGSIFIRNQYIESFNVEAKYDWREKLKNPEELQKFLMFLLHRAHQIYSKKSKIKMQTEDETKKRYSELVQGSITKFLSEHFITKNVPITIGTSFVWLLTKYNEVNKDTISSKALVLMLEELGLEKYNQKWVYLTNESNVFTEIKKDGISEDKVQKTVIMGLRPTVISKSATNLPNKPIKTELSESDNT